MAKTCDGRLRLKGSIGGMGGGDGDATWDFSLDTRGEQGQEEMMEFIHAQKSKNVTLHYTKPWQVWPWRGKNEGALVYLVELAEEVASENVLEEAEK